MTRTWVAIFGLAAALAACRAAPAADEAPYGKGMTEANKERLELDDMKDVSDWYNGSPEETSIAASDRHTEGGGRALLFGNVVDHTKGEKNYPVGWPRVGKDLSREDLSDWSGYDFFECRIYVETSRQTLPKNPLGVGFYHTGHKRSSHFPLARLKKDAWVKIVIPVAELLDPKDVRRVQFNISESDYRHGDRVDFYIDDLVLTRFVEPAVAELELERKMLFSNERTIRARYKLVGYKRFDETTVELRAGPADGEAFAKAVGKASRQGDMAAPTDRALKPGTYRATLNLRDAEGKLIDRRQTEFRVIAGPFGEE